MTYGKADKFWLGRLAEHPEIMTQDGVLKELEANLRDASRMMNLEDVPNTTARKSSTRPTPR